MVPDLPVALRHDVAVMLCRITLHTLGAGNTDETFLRTVARVVLAWLDTAAPCCIFDRAHWETCQCICRLLRRSCLLKAMPCHNKNRLQCFCMFISPSGCAIALIGSISFPLKSCSNACSYSACSSTYIATYILSHLHSTCARSADGWTNEQLRQPCNMLCMAAMMC